MQQRALNCLSFWNQTSLAAYSCQLYLPTTYFSRGRFISPRLAPWSVKQEWMTELWGQQMGAALGLAPKAPLAELTWCCSRGHFPLVLLSWEWLKNQKGRQDKRWPGPFLLPQCLRCRTGCIVESQDLEMECFFPLTCAIFSDCELVLCKWPQSWNIPAAWRFRYWSSISPATSLQILDYWFFFLFVNSPQRCFIVWGKQQQKEKRRRTGKTEEHTTDTRSLASQMS